MTIGIAGAGRVAQALGRRLRERGLPIAAVASRNSSHAAEAADFIGGAKPVEYEALDCDRVLIAVPDAAIVEVAARIPPPKIALHTCGASGADLLDTLARTGAHCGSLHPLQTFPTPLDGYRVLPGCWFAIDGDETAAQWAMELATLLDGFVLRIPARHRAIYHAAGVMAGNYVTAMIDAAIETMQRTGVSESESRQALAGIARAALENTLRLGSREALTGPIVRGDANTVERHLAALVDSPEAIRDLYRAAGRQALQIAIRRGLDPGAARVVRNKLEGANG